MKNISIEQFNTLLDECGLNKKDFSELSQVPYGTILNWGTSRGNKEKLKIPLWVEPFMELYKKSKKNP